MRTLQGTICSDRMVRTVVVRVDRLRRHPKYRKFYRVSRKYKADVGTVINLRVGDVVRIQETRPLSRGKHWRVVAVVREGTRRETMAEEEAEGSRGPAGVEGEVNENTRELL